MQGNRKSPFIMVTVTQHKMISACKRALEDGFAFSTFPALSYEVYETNIEYNLRFMVDTGVVGCQWIEVPAGTYRVRDAAHKRALCQLEIDVGYESFIAHAPEGEWGKVGRDAGARLPPWPESSPHPRPCLTDCGGSRSRPSAS